MEGRVSWRPGNAERLAARARGWQDSGATHLSVNTMGAGLASVDGHLEALSEVAAALQLTSRPRSTNLATNLDLRSLI